MFLLKRLLSSYPRTTVFNRGYVCLRGKAKTSYINQIETLEPREP